MYRTLILNHTYKPHAVKPWKDAVIQMFGGDIEVLVQYDEVLAVLGRRALDDFPELKRALRQVVGTDTESITIKVPAVAVLRRQVSLVKTGVKFSKPNICTRDEFRCQYCSAKLPMSKLTYDHVLPRKPRSGSEKGKTVWENVVAACSDCNSKKDNRTPEEAGMPLLSVPRRPHVLPMTGPFLERSNVPEEWLPFINVA
jgi:5-methylcytosine-specific restriction endonuclease McrA